MKLSMRVLHCSAAIAIMAAVSVARGNDVSSSFDEFTGTSSWFIDLTGYIEKDQDGVSVETGHRDCCGSTQPCRLSAAAISEKRSHPSYALIGDFWSDDWVFLDALAIKIGNSTPRNIKLEDVRREVISGSTREKFTILLSRPYLDSLASTTDSVFVRVSGQYGRITFLLGDSGKANLGKLLNAVDTCGADQ